MLIYLLRDPGGRQKSLLVGQISKVDSSGSPFLFSFIPLSGMKENNPAEAT